MLLTGGARFGQVNTGARPASILAYSRQNSQVSGIVQELERQPALHKAGHKLVAVQDFSGFDQALKSGKYDLVLADSADADGLAQEIRSAPSRPVLLPVLYRPTKTEATAVEKKFHCLLKAPASPNHYLAAIGDAMERRSAKPLRR
jgi:DNA-binding NtrC family response regulator